MQLWLAYQCILWQARTEKAMIEQARGGGRVDAPAKRHRESTATEFFAMTGITPQRYPNLASDRLKREAQN